MAVCTVCPVAEPCIQSAAGSKGCCGSLFVSNGSNQGNIFELTGLRSRVSKKTVLQLLTWVVLCNVMLWAVTKMILLNTIVQNCSVQLLRFS